MLGYTAMSVRAGLIAATGLGALRITTTLRVRQGEGLKVPGVVEPPPTELDAAGPSARQVQALQVARADAQESGGLLTVHQAGIGWVGCGKGQLVRRAALGEGYSVGHLVTSGYRPTWAATEGFKPAAGWKKRVRRLRQLGAGNYLEAWNLASRMRRGRVSGTTL
jgi:hypothetical protein